jgi:hypothetical protein
MVIAAVRRPSVARQSRRSIEQAPQRVRCTLVREAADAHPKARTPVSVWRARIGETVDRGKLPAPGGHQIFGSQQATASALIARNKSSGQVREPAPPSGGGPRKEYR